MRQLTYEEKKLIADVASKLDEGKRQLLLNDLARATVALANGDASLITFELSGYERPPYRGQHSYGIEGRVLDRDGVELSVLLYADENGRLFQLELMRWGDGDVRGPRWETLKLH
jgi:hypothetical protein